MLLRAAAIALLISSSAFAQDLEARYQEKLEKNFAKEVEWHLTLDAAKKASKEKNLPIIAYFTRSYAP